MSASDVFKKQNPLSDPTDAALERILNGVDVAVVVVAADDSIVYANQNAAQVLGLQVGIPAATRFPLSVLRGLMSACRLPLSDGTLISLEISSSAINWKGAGGRVLTIRDVSTHRRAVLDVSTRCEAAESKAALLLHERDCLLMDLSVSNERHEAIAADLTRSEERFRVAFEQGPIGKAIVDESLQFVDANRAFRGMFGYTRAEICAKYIFDLIHPEDLCSAIKRCRRAFQRSLPHVTLDTRCVARDGHTMHVRVTSTRIESRHANPPSVLFHVEDRTEQVLIAERVRVNERLAAIGSLAAGVAHEINNPVGAALLSAESALRLLDRDEEPEGLRRCLENIRAAMLRCGQISHKTLRVLSANRAETQLCNMGDLVRRVIDQVRCAQQSTRAVFVLNVESGLTELRVNELEFELVLVNLLANSLQNSPPAVQVTVSVERAENETVRVTVADNGPGMSREQLERVFDPFFTTRRQSGGTGIGMSVVQRIVADHGGSLSVNSARETGTRITILLPSETIPTPTPRVES